MRDDQSNQSPPDRRGRPRKTINTGNISEQLRKSDRAHAALALASQGMSQTEIAQALSVSRNTVRADLASTRNGAELALSILSRADRAIERDMPVERRIEQYVAHAEQSDDRAASLRALERLDDLQGIVTARDARTAPAGGASILIAGVAQFVSSLSEREREQFIVVDQIPADQLESREPAPQDHPDTA